MAWSFTPGPQRGVQKWPRKTTKYCVEHISENSGLIGIPIITIRQYHDGLNCWWKSTYLERRSLYWDGLTFQRCNYHKKEERWTRSEVFISVSLLVFLCHVLLYCLSYICLNQFRLECNVSKRWNYVIDAWRRHTSNTISQTLQISKIFHFEVNPIPLERWVISHSEISSRSRFKPFIECD